MGNDRNRATTGLPYHNQPLAIPMAAGARASLSGGMPRQSLGPARVTRPSLGGVVGGIAAGAVNAAAAELAGMGLGGGPGESRSRMSFAPVSRPSIDPRESLNRRSSAFGKSLVPGSQPLPQSLGNASFAAGSKDPRPIREKSYQLEVIKNLINFLVKAGYAHPISQKILTAPSGKDFQNIFKFLYAQLDPAYDFSGKKFEEEVPVLMKGLRYPFAGDLSKSQLYAVGSMHAWPGLLAMLGWMVELIGCCDELEARYSRDPLSEAEHAEDADVGTGAGAAAERIFFDYLCKSYKVFLAGSDNFDPMVAELSATFERRNETVYREVEMLDRSVADLQSQYEHLVGEEPPLAKAQREMAIYGADIEKFQKFIGHLEVKRQKFEEAIERLSEDIAQCERELSEAEMQRAALQAQVDAQDICPEDIDRMNADKEQLVKTLESLAQAKEEANRIFWERELQAQRKLDGVERLVQEYNSAGERLAIIPSEAGNSQGQQFELIFNSHATRFDQLVTPDIRTKIRPTLGLLREGCHGEIHQSQDQLLSLQETLDRLSEQCADKQEALRVGEERLKRLVQSYLEQKEQSGVENKRTDEESEQLEQTIQRMRSEMSSQALHSQQRLQRAAIDYDQLVGRVAGEKERLGTTIYSVLEDLIGFKTHIEASLTDLAAAFSKEYTQINGGGHEEVEGDEVGMVMVEQDAENERRRMMVMAERGGAGKDKNISE